MEVFDSKVDFIRKTKYLYKLIEKRQLGQNDDQEEAVVYNFKFLVLPWRKADVNFGKGLMMIL